MSISRPPLNGGGWVVQGKPDDQPPLTVTVKTESDAYMAAGALFNDFARMFLDAAVACRKKEQHEASRPKLILPN